MGKKDIQLIQMSFKNIQLKKIKEFPVVAYRRFHVDDTSERKAYLNDFSKTQRI